MIYKDYQRNHLILPGRENALQNFLNQTHNGIRHKQQHKCNSNSEDALTWSCFEMLSSLPLPKKLSVLDEIFEDAYQGKGKPLFKHGLFEDEHVQIYIGKEYTGLASKESTEVDASIELPGALVFFEAKLYSAMSQASQGKRDQIARKLRVGLDAPLNDAREFFFIFLDIAPLDKLKAGKKAGQKNNVEASSSAGFNDKWKSAWWFNHYKYAADLEPLSEALAGITDQSSVQPVAENMGWLTWSDLFKSILRSMA